MNSDEKWQDLESEAGQVACEPRDVQREIAALRDKLSEARAIAQGVTHHETCWKSSEGYKRLLELRDAVREHISDGLHAGPRSQRLRDALWNVDAAKERK